MDDSEGKDVVCRVESIVCFYNNASDIIQRVKQERAKRRAPAPPRVLEESIQCAPQDIQREKDRGLNRFGSLFEQGDEAALSGLQDVQNKLDKFSKHLQELADSEHLADFRHIADEADAARDEAVDTLIRLRQRLLASESSPVVSPSSPVPPVIASPPRSTLPSPPLEPDIAKPKTYHMPHRHQWLGMHNRSHSTTYDQSRDASGEEDATVGGAENHHHHHKKHGSILHFLKHHRTHSIGDKEGEPLHSAHSPEEARKLSRTVTSGSLDPSMIALRNGSNASFAAPEKQQGWWDGQRNDSQAGLPRRSYEHRDSHASVASVDTVVSVAPSIFSNTTRGRHASSATSIMRNPSFNGTTPTPENEYLGFCKGAVRLQHGDKKALEKRKEFNDGWSQSAVHYYACCSTKCTFASHIDINVIMTKVWLVEDKGLKFRWPFLAKSHVPQVKVKEHAYGYQCILCVFSGVKSPVFHGTDFYLEHVSTHRGDVDSVALYKARCINDHEAEDKEDFDLNLFPLPQPQEYQPPQMLSDDLAALHMQPEPVELEGKPTPWNEGLSNFHYGGAELE